MVRGRANEVVGAGYANSRAAIVLGCKASWCQSQHVALDNVMLSLHPDRTLVASGNPVVLDRASITGKNQAVVVSRGRSAVGVDTHKVADDLAERRIAHDVGAYQNRIRGDSAERECIQKYVPVGDVDSPNDQGAARLNGGTHIERLLAEAVQVHACARHAAELISDDLMVCTSEEHDALNEVAQTNATERESSVASARYTQCVACRA